MSHSHIQLRLYTPDSRYPNEQQMLDHQFPNRRQILGHRFPDALQMPASPFPETAMYDVGSSRKFLDDNDIHPRGIRPHGNRGFGAASATISEVWTVDCHGQSRSVW